MITDLDIRQANTRIRTSRERKHLLKELEFKTIEFLCPRIPKFITPDILTIIGLLGSLIVALGMIYAIYNPYALIISVFGFALQWFGDSLDGRIAYYRNTPRKWYGWVLDINADWISISLIGLGFYFYLPQYKFLAFIFALAYGGSMILSLLRYKINNQYIIDKGILGPTEMRIIICLILLAEVFIGNVMLPFMLIGSITMIIMNISESITVVKAGDLRDINEKKAKLNT
jgi:phosphatidylglycerophosphate synthase